MLDVILYKCEEMIFHTNNGEKNEKINIKHNRHSW